MCLLNWVITLWIPRFANKRYAKAAIELTDKALVVGSGTRTKRYSWEDILQVEVVNRLGQHHVIVHVSPKAEPKLWRDRLIFSDIYEIGLEKLANQIDGHINLHHTVYA